MAQADQKAIVFYPKDKCELNRCRFIGEVVEAPLFMLVGKSRRPATYFVIDVSKIRVVNGFTHLYSFKIPVRTLDNTAKYCRDNLNCGMLVRVDGELYEETYESGNRIALHAKRVVLVKVYNGPEPQK